MRDSARTDPAPNAGSFLRRLRTQTMIDDQRTDTPAADTAPTLSEKGQSEAVTPTGHRNGQMRCSFIWPSCRHFLRELSVRDYVDTIGHLRPRSRTVVALALARQDVLNAGRQLGEICCQLGEGGAGSGNEDYDDEEAALIRDALEVLRITRKASTSMIQRKLKIGYNRAARIMDDLEERGIIGPDNGNAAQGREILVDLEMTVIRE